MTLSIIIPTLNEADDIARMLQSLQAFRTWGHEVIVVDGGSSDATVETARPFVDQMLETVRGRARQMNAGAAAAHRDVLVFLHADTRLPRSADRAIRDALCRKKRLWGRFDVRLSGRHPFLRVVERAMNLRSRLTGIATGDQAIFVRRRAFKQVGGFADVPLMEDIILSCTLRGVSRPACITKKATTSSRRWERQGIIRTMLNMWSLRLLFFLGADPARLAQSYYGTQSRVTSD
jgi:rSAM/selenodomain-associated transferase 2